MTTTMISGLPLTITQPGTYVLSGDLTTDGHGISVQADNVVIDLNGYTISGPTDSNTETFGVSAFDQTNVTVKNGSIDGFMYGIYLSDIVANKSSTADMTSTGHVVENLTISNATFRGARVEGNDNVIQNNVIENIGGTTVYEHAYAFGIEVFGASEVLDNEIIEVRGRGATDIGEGVGIS
ncbi:MAG: hypothetical protein AAFZ01_14400, partial [Pseudomonadota bacterium]